MIVQVRKSIDGVAPSVYLIAENVDEERGLADLVDLLKGYVSLTRESYVVTVKGANNVLLAASKENRSRRS